MSQPEAAPDETRAERDARIVELEAKLARPRASGVFPPVAAVALAGALTLLWQQRADLQYYFSSRAPIDLGAEGDYRFPLARDNRYVQLRGQPTSRAAYWEERGQTWVAVGVRESPILVKRRTLSTEAWNPGLRPPRPDQRPFEVRGRLRSRAAAHRYESAFAEHLDFGEVNPTWLLEAEVRPGGDFGAAAWAGFLAAFAALNAWFLARGVAVRWLGRLPPASGAGPG
jgi:hypothetical protein